MEPKAATSFRARYSNSGTFSLLSNTTKQVLATVLSSTIGGAGRVVADVDGATLTKNATVCGLDISTDGGATWTTVPGLSFSANAAQHFHLEVTTVDSVRLFVQSGTSEGAVRSLPWKINVF